MLSAVGDAEFAARRAEIERYRQERSGWVNVQVFTDYSLLIYVFVPGTFLFMTGGWALWWTG